LQIYGESPVLDPMAGIGTTLVEAMLLGMDAVGVEYEKKFVDQANRNIEHLKKLFPNKKLGNAICIEGDARDLSCLNSQKVRSVIFSPPYFNAIESVSTGHQGPEDGHLERQHKLAKLGRSGYGKKSNIGHVESYGSIVFSPPYFNAIKKGDEGPHARSKKISYEERVNRFQGYSTDKENIGNISKLAL
jgi:DNA modification methylase